MPWKSKNGHYQWVNLEYFLPYGGWMSIFRDFNDQNYRELRKDIGLNNPFLSLIEAWGSGKDPFTGKEIYNKVDSPADQWLSIFNYVYKMWAPSMLTDSGAVGYTASIGEKDKWGKTITPGQAVGRWFGVNIVTVSPAQTMVGRKARINELKKDLYKILSDPSISNEKKKVANKRFALEQNKIMKGEK